MEVLPDVRAAGEQHMIVAAARRAATVVLFAGAAACATGSSGVPGAAGDASGSLTSTAAPGWHTTAHEHVDLWLHGYAMLSRDTALVPLFARGYREHIEALKARSNVETMLDANRDHLAAQLGANPALVNGQFVPLYFTTFEEIQQVVPLFLRAGGNPGATNDPQLRLQFAVLASSFPTAADRDWLRLFLQSLADERTRFFDDYWRAAEARRVPVRQAVDSLWRLYQPKLQRYLTNTQQAGGEFILSLPLDGEGRTITAARLENAVTTSFPDTATAAVEAIYVFVHEITGAVTAPAIADNTTPAQQRSSVAAEYTAHAAVRAGAMLLEQTIPELAPGYMRYYLRESGATPPAAGLPAAFAARFPLPDAIRDAIAGQLETVLGGI